MKTQRIIGIGVSSLSFVFVADNSRTIHGMVYNAMKLFMEINPQLFDECSHHYNEMQLTAETREKSRQDRWDKLSQLARSLPPPSTSQAAPSGGPAQDVERVTQERLNALNLQEESPGGNEQGRSKELSASVSYS